MNVENILKVADAIESHSVPLLGFNMEWFITSANDVSPDRSGSAECDTVACIAGWTHVLFDNVKEDVGTYSRALELLGLTDNQARNLFYAKNHPYAVEDGWGDVDAPLAEITSAQAVAVLRHLAATGKVDWSIASPSTAPVGE